MKCAAESSADLDAYLIGFVQRDPQETEKFVSIAQPYLLKLARDFASELPRDLWKEIVEQTYVNLLGNVGAKFNPQRGKAKVFLYDVVRNATLQVRAQYHLPGQPTRNRKSRVQKQEEDGQEKKLTIVPISEVEKLAATRNTACEIMARCDARMILGKAPRRIAAALYRMYFVGEALDDVAHHIGVDRFKLKRLVKAYSLQLRQAS
ncbi:MAG TPA: hypothetical protein VF708_01425 [Pyrinomonadaceae bacterium]|jgi:hypothetical protein